MARTKEARNSDRPAARRFGGVSGLGTLLSGAFVEFDPTAAGAQFVGPPGRRRSPRVQGPIRPAHRSPGLDRRGASLLSQPRDGQVLGWLAEDGGS
jgi:hypothetical protein